MPSPKRNLPWSHTLGLGWSRKVATKHAVPLTKRPAFLVATHCVQLGVAWLGLGMLRQVYTGLRPRLILPPEDQEARLLSAPTVIVLGAREGTKVRRLQVAMLKADAIPLPHLLRLCKRNTPDGLFMFPSTLMDYHYMSRLGECKLGIKVGLSPPSGRAGFATDEKLLVTPFEVIREGGRLQPDSSL